MQIHSRRKKALQTPLLNNHTGCTKPRKTNEPWIAIRKLESCLTVRWLRQPTKTFWKEDKRGNPNLHRSPYTWTIAIFDSYLERDPCHEISFPVSKAGCNCRLVGVTNCCGRQLRDLTYDSCLGHVEGCLAVEHLLFNNPEFSPNTNSNANELMGKTRGKGLLQTPKRKKLKTKEYGSQSLVAGSRELLKIKG